MNVRALTIGALVLAYGVPLVAFSVALRYRNSCKVEASLILNPLDLPRSVPTVAIKPSQPRSIKYGERP